MVLGWQLDAEDRWLQWKEDHEIGFRMELFLIQKASQDFLKILENPIIGFRCQFGDALTWLSTHFVCVL